MQSHQPTIIGRTVHLPFERQAALPIRET